MEHVDDGGERWRACPWLSSLFVNFSELETLEFAISEDLLSIFSHSSNLLFPLTAHLLLLGALHEALGTTSLCPFLSLSIFYTSISNHGKASNRVTGDAWEPRYVLGSKGG